MKIVKDIHELKAQVKAWRAAGQTVGFVPTMGNLHQGHASLVEQARDKADKVVVSIFVNPMQFDNQEDLAAYPRTVEDDCAVLQSMHTDMVFLPTPKTIYPDGLDNQTFVEVPVLSDMHCGQSRPGHFRGVTTVVNKLFNLVQPDLAVFGEKDFQQLLIIRRMVEDLFIDVEIIGAPTKRETSGLAMSSRNNYLSKDQREGQAPVIYQALKQIRSEVLGGVNDFAQLELEATQTINQAGLETDFISILNANNLEPAQSGDHRLVILAAAFLGKARLIDNLYFEL